MVRSLIPGKDTWKMKNAKKKVYEKSCKGYVTGLDTNSAAFIGLPKEEKKGLGITMPYLLF